MFFEYADGSMTVLDNSGIHPVNRDAKEVGDLNAVD